MKSIQLPQEFVALVDDEDYSRLNGHSWQICFAVCGTAYAFRRPYLRKENGKDVWGSRVTMHREIMLPDEDTEVDHIRHYVAERVIDNRRQNLRLCSHAENMRNSKKRKDGATSPFKGVSRTRKGPRFWVAMVGTDPGRITKKHFEETDAAIWYDRNALEMYGEFARTNIIGPHAIYASLPLSPNPDNSPPVF